MLRSLRRVLGLFASLFVLTQISLALAQDNISKTYSGKIILSVESFPKKIDEELEKFLKTNSKKDGAYSIAGDGKSSWSVNLFSVLSKDPGGASLSLVFYDRDDKESQKRLEPIQNVEISSVKGNRFVSVPNIELSPDASFATGKTYLIRLTQLKAGKEVVLSEAQLTLTTK
jgi:hypothetical protein